MGPRFNYEQFGDSTCPITGHLCTLACPQYTITDSHSVPSNKAGCGACMNMNRNFTSIKGVTWESPKESGPLDAGLGTGLAQVHGHQFCPLWPVIYNGTPFVCPWAIVETRLSPSTIWGWRDLDNTPNASAIAAQLCAFAWHPERILKGTSLKCARHSGSGPFAARRSIERII